MATPLRIDYYSDILCVWAWIAQPRLNELKKQWGNQIRIYHRYVDVFGDVEKKIEDSWTVKGGFSGFAQHVQHAVDKFDEITVNPQLWQKVQPKTSASAHLVVKAVELAHGAAVAETIDFRIRESFFLEAGDISSLDFLFEQLKSANLNSEEIQTQIHNGAAMTALMNDYRRAQTESIKGSPTYVLDGGRQVLFGDVGYRVIHANIEELLRRPSGAASWC